jgi:hypothetical protein
MYVAMLRVAQTTPLINTPVSLDAVWVPDDAGGGGMDITAGVGVCVGVCVCAGARGVLVRVVSVGGGGGGGGDAVLLDLLCAERSGMRMSVNVVRRMSFFIVFLVFND